MSGYVKDPDEVLDYSIDFTDWMPTGDTVSSYTATVAGATKGADSVTDSVVTAFISAGTAGTVATFEAEIVTTGGRTKQATMNIEIRER